MSPLRIIDEFSSVAPFGVCFHDTASGQKVEHGLEVSVFPVNSNFRKTRTPALPNRVGVYVLQRIVGQENYLNGSGDQEFWNNNPPQRQYIVEVFDNAGRFQPFRFDARLPVKGLYGWESNPVTSPVSSLSSIPLYSAPSRKVLSGMSVVRSHLQQVDGTLASWAVLEAHFNGRLVGRGIADHDGQVVLMFPSLPPQTDPFASPPANATQVSLSDQKWVLDFSVKYQPGIFQTSPPSQTLTEDLENNFPNLRLVLAQANGTLWADRGQTEEYKTAALQFGKDLILRSRDASVSSPMPDPETALLSYLFVSPAI